MVDHEGKVWACDIHGDQHQPECWSCGAVAEIERLRAEPTGIDIIRKYLGKERHPTSEVCPGCGNAGLSTTGITKLAYAWDHCDCGTPEYTHLVEQLWHLECLVEGGHKLVEHELLDAARYALRRKGPGCVQQRERVAQRIDAALSEPDSNENTGGDA